jgi:serine/threonine protein phosphatase PrpC
VTGLTHRGRVRPLNQDAAAVAGWRLLDGVVAQHGVRLREPLCCAVADGAGGHPAGERASAAALAALMAHEGIADTAALGEAIAAANARLFDEMTADPTCRGMATTLATLVATEDDILLGNVGDSRIYEITRQGVLQLSVDDRPERPEWAGADYETSVLTQVVGGFEPDAAPVPHLDRCALEPGLRFLLCTDGLGACLDDDAVGDVVARASGDAAAVRDLLTAALTAGAPDNVTLMIVRFERTEAR